MTARLRNLLLLVRDMERSTAFYGQGLGLPVLSQLPTLVKLGEEERPILLKPAAGEAQCTAGYTPFLNFDVLDMDSTVPALLGLGGILDGPIKHSLHGKVAVIRSPDGHMVSLHERDETYIGRKLGAVEGLAGLDERTSSSGGSGGKESTPPA